MQPLTQRILLAMATVALTAAIVLPASAAGTDGVEMAILVARDDDRTPTIVVSGRDGADIRISNRTDEARSVRVFALDATIVDGSVELGSPGSADFARIDEALELGPREESTITLELLPRRLPADDGYLAVVLEVQRSPSLVTQAVNVVRYVQGGSEPLPRWPAVLAVVLVAVTAGAIRRFGVR